MAPRDVSKVTPKIQRTLKANIMKSQSSTVKKAMTRKPIEKTPSKDSSNETRLRTNTVSKLSTPNPKESKLPPDSKTKSAKKSAWKRRPKPAHSGVPVPEKMKRLLEKQFQDADSSL